MHSEAYIYFRFVIRESSCDWLKLQLCGWTMRILTKPVHLTHVTDEEKKSDSKVKCSIKILNISLLV